MLIIGPAAAALDWAERLSGQLEVSVLATDASGELPLERKFPVWSGKVTGLSGWLGAFEVEWRQDNPIDLEVCTRCNACIRACPEDAIDFSYQVDLAKCKSHRACVKACGAIGAIDFSRSDTARKESFDLVLDLSRQPLIRTARSCRRATSRRATIRSSRRSPRSELAALVGEFEKPRFFQYKEKICAHSRSGKQGCNACIDVCSSGAIQRRRRPRQGRAAPVRRLRRLRHRLPVGRDDLRLSEGGRPRHAAEDRCSRPTATPAARTPAS